MRMKKEFNIGKDLITIRNSRKAYLPAYLMILAVIALLIYLKIEEFPLHPYALIAAAVFIIGTIKTTEIHRLRNYYEITSNYMIHKKGLFTKEIKRIFIPTISDIGLKQTPWQRLLNYGTVKIHRYSEGPTIDVKNINSPIEFMDILEGVLNRKPKA